MRKQITFKNNKGEMVELPSSMTIEEMAKQGIELRIDPKGTPLPDNWYRNASPDDENPPGAAPDQAGAGEP